MPLQRVVLLDSDMIVRRNMDELMEMDLPRDQIAASHVCACNIYKLPYYPADWRVSVMAPLPTALTSLRRVPENCAHTSVQHPMQVPVIEEGSPRPYTQLNSGTVVLTPSVELDAALEEFMHTSPLVPSFMFADQDLLTAFFVGRWRPLPWYYNALLWLSYVHKPLWADAEIRCLHYIGRKKPWHGRVAAEPQCQAYIDWWWAALDRLEDDLKQRDPESWKLVASGVSA
jgi:lipopolysaccharide biosynthesis glycosyltransferase